jgi:hypothetical protein
MSTSRWRRLTDARANEHCIQCFVNNNLELFGVDADGVTGAMVRNCGRLRALADPVRAPGQLLSASTLRGQVRRQRQAAAGGDVPQAALACRGGQMPQAGNPKQAQAAMGPTDGSKNPCAPRNTGGAATAVGSASPGQASRRGTERGRRRRRSGEADNHGDLHRHRVAGADHAAAVLATVIRNPAGAFPTLGADTLEGGAASDTFDGGGGLDVVTGGDDRITVRALGRFDGGGNDDTFLVRSAGPGTAIDGGSGDDTLDPAGALDITGALLSSLEFLALDANPPTLTAAQLDGFLIAEAANAATDGALAPSAGGRVAIEIDGLATLTVTGSDEADELPFFNPTLPYGRVHGAGRPGSHHARDRAPHRSPPSARTPGRPPLPGPPRAAGGQTRRAARCAVRRPGDRDGPADSPCVRGRVPATPRPARPHPTGRWRRGSCAPRRGARRTGARWRRRRRG